MTWRCALVGLLVVLGAGGVQASPVYVASQGAGTLVALAPGPSVSASPVVVGRSPAQVAPGPNGLLYLTHPDARQISVFDARRGSLVRTFPVDGQPFGIAVSADGARLFVGDWAGDRVMRLSAETGALEGTVSVGKEPAALVLDRRGRLYVADRESRQVSVVDSLRLERIATIPVGEAPFALALDPTEDRLYVANVRSGTVSVIDTVASRTIATFAIGGMPYGVAVSPDGGLILVTNQQGGTLVVVDATDGMRRATVPVGRYPEGVVIAEASAYVANWFSDSVSVIDMATLRETARIAVPDGPRSLAVARGGDR
ncbi:YncE family protein [Methylobacterium sp. 37f]|uniref:YncE family protein n=1 Tax=Methylobacterium sp. 37f TaxID=2817058 RepID=UPI001FFCE98F|nr:YncE family protein [Methylobacterium sp. 37f]MCK2053755.1 YncE family protein [Methylobacterium sp. 37f]